MGWLTILALVVIIPVILIPVAFVWYLNIVGIHAVLKEAREKRTASKKELKAKTAESPVEINNALD